MMDVDTMKVEAEAEACCICNTVSEELFTPEEYDTGAPPSQAPLRSMLMHINNNKSVPSGRLCSSCIARTLESYNFNTMLASKGPPPLSEKIRALRKRLYELSQKIDVFIVVGGGGAGAGGAYSSEDIILVEKEALAAAAAADAAELAAARDSRGDAGYQCSVCPAFYQRASEYRAHVATHPTDSPHSCWSCGAQFTELAPLHQHTRAYHSRDRLVCHLCDTELQSESALQAHWCGGACPVCSLQCRSRAELALHARSHPRLCPACFLRLPTPAAQAAHQLTHTRARRYVCATDSCILRFNNRSELLQHIRKCHGEAPPPAPAPAAPAPTPCPYCDRTFATVAAMKRHTRVHREARDQQEESEWGETPAAEEYLELDTLEDIEELS